MAKARVPITILFIAHQVWEWAAPLIGALHRHGYYVLPAATVREAEAVGQDLGLASVDLAIMTLQPSPHDQMLEASTLMHHWGVHVPHLPWILISNDPLPDRLASPVVWWLATPLTPDTLLAVVRDTLDHSCTFDAQRCRGRTPKRLRSMLQIQSFKSVE
jgi:hypothetical protein